MNSDCRIPLSLEGHTAHERGYWGFPGEAMSISGPPADLPRHHARRLIEVTVAAGFVERFSGFIDDLYRTGKTEPYRSSLATAHFCRCARLDAAIPRRYLRGVSAENMRPAVSAPVGKDVVRGLSPYEMTRFVRGAQSLAGT